VSRHRNPPPVTLPMPAATPRGHRSHLAGALAVTVLLSAAAVVPFALPRSVPAQATQAPVRAVGVGYRICPVADCAHYPRPAEIRGIALSSLENWLLFTRSAEAQIRAVSTPGHPRHKSWHGNAIRLQLLQDKLVGPKGNLWSPGYYRAIQAIIAYALHRRLAVIVNAQSEPATGFPENEQGPTVATYAFWRHFTRSYGHNPRVVFDLFNEPRCEPHNAGYSSAVCNWRAWWHAMWPLARYVRSIGSENQLWLEGNRWGSQLGGVPLIPCHQAVAWCQGIVYSFHKPGCPWPNKCAATARVWWNQFGYLAAAGVPVVNGEMTNYRGGYYWSHSTQTMGKYLGFLHQYRIGVVAWSLQPGIMTATSSLTSAVSEPQGAGRLFWRYFHHEPLPGH
jgi:hypothetical protein